MSQLLSWKLADLVNTIQERMRIELNESIQLYTAAMVSCVGLVQPSIGQGVKPSVSCRECRLYSCSHVRTGAGRSRRCVTHHEYELSLKHRSFVNYE